MKKVIAITVAFFLPAPSFAWVHRMPYSKTKPPIGTVLDRNDTLTYGLIGAWPMNERGGNKANDISGNNNTGTISKINAADSYTWSNNGITTSPFNNNTAIYLSLPTTALPNLGTSAVPDFTLAAFLAPFAAPIVILQHHTGTFGNQLKVSYSLTQVTFNYDLNYVTNWAISLPTVPAWYIFVKHGTTATVYFNNAVACTFSVAANVTGDNTQAKTILQGGGIVGGGSHNTYVEYLAYNRALSRSEIQSLSNNPFALFRAPQITFVNPGTAAPGVIYNAPLFGTGY